MSQHVGNGANKIVWAVCGVLALGYLAFIAWTADMVVDLRDRVTVLETRAGVNND